MSESESSIEARAVEHILQLLWLRRMTRADLARAMGADKATVNRLLGHKQQLTVKYLGRIADVLGVEPEQLLTGALPDNQPEKAAV